MYTSDVVRLRNEWLKSQREAAEERERIRSLELEQAKMKAEQARLAREQIRMAAEQERQAALLEKHEEELRKLYFKIDQAEDIIAHHTEMLEMLNSQRDAVSAEIKEITDKISICEDELDVYKASKDSQFSGVDGALLYMDKFAIAKEQQGHSRKSADVEKLRKRKTTLEGRLLTLESKIFSTEQKIKKAEYDKYEAQRKIA